ncbi:MAG: hypothetical protein E7293_09275 [Lachnospiraceae bacterium]|nr:hypothetical protein [Lachnospiraceae bacterium]
MNWLLIVLALILIWRIVEGFKHGMVKEIVSFVSLLVVSILIALIGTAVTSYFKKDITSLIVAVILLVAVAIIHRLLSLIFFSAKVVAKLPVVHSFDKLLGVVIGVLETILMIWTVYILLINVDTGHIGQEILRYVQDSKILSFLYANNYLAQLLSIISDKISVLPIDILQ